MHITNSPSARGMSTFISDDLLVTISAFKASLLKYTWQPSVFWMEIVGNAPSV
jgi:hypothetical protein